MARTLYGISGSRALRSIWAIEEMGIEYEHVPTHFMGDSKKPEYLAVNPNGRIPTLVDGNLTLFESMAINLYLARTYDGGLQPKSSEDEARALQWSFWGISELEPHLIAMLLNKIMLPEPQRSEAAVSAAEQAISRPLAVLEAQLAGVSYLLGDAFSIADLNVASVLSMAGMVRYDLAAFPQVADWLGRCTSRPALARARER